MAFDMFEELKRRKVFRVAVVYLAVGFVLLQVAELLADGLLLPDSFRPMVTSLLILGFPVALVLAWAFELTPEGLKREEDAPVDGGAPRAESASGRFRTPMRIWVAVAAVVLIVGAYWFRPRPAGTAGLANPVVAFTDSVAILPIEKRTGDPALEHMAAATMERMIGQLHSVGSVKVSDQFSSRRYAEKQPELTPRQIADSLGVEKLIYSSLNEGPLRLELTVIHSANATPLWQKTYSTDTTLAANPADQLADKFVSEYLERYPAAMEARAGASGSSREDYGLISRAQRALGQRTPAGLAEARRTFKEAVEADSTDARAFAGLSQAHSLSLTYRYATGNEGFRDAALALAYANRAIELDSTLADGYSARAYVATRSSAPLDAVVPDCGRALERAPADATANSWCARVFNQQGDDEIALQLLHRAIAADPAQAGRRIALAYSALKQGRVEIAVEQAREASRIEPDLVLSRAIEARALLLGGRTAECLRMSLGPHAGIRAACLHEAGRPAEGRAIVDSLEAAILADALEDSTYTAVIRAEDLATYYAWTGDADEATEWATRAYLMSPFGIEMRVLESPLFDRVRLDGRFSQEVGLKRQRAWSRVQDAASQVR